MPREPHLLYPRQPVTQPGYVVDVGLADMAVAQHKIGAFDRLYWGTGGKANGFPTPPAGPFTLASFAKVMEYQGPNVKGQPVFVKQGTYVDLSDPISDGRRQNWHIGTCSGTLEQCLAFLNRGGKFSLRSRVLRGDHDSKTGSGQRAEVANWNSGYRIPLGVEMWHAWASWVPLNFNANPWSVIQQYHGGSGSPVFSATVDNGVLNLLIRSGEHPSRPGPGGKKVLTLRRSIWNVFLMRARFMTDDRGSNTVYHCLAAEG